jgi:hypothetical protein
MLMSNEAMTEPRLISLDRWRALTYGDDPRAPCLQTVYRWCRAGKIQPPPEKHGRAYFLDPDARYTDRPEPTPDQRPSLIERIRAEEAKA